MPPKKAVAPPVAKKAPVKAVPAKVAPKAGAAAPAKKVTSAAPVKKAAPPAKKEEEKKVEEKKIEEKPKFVEIPKEPVLGESVITYSTYKTSFKHIDGMLKWEDVDEEYCFSSAFDEGNYELKLKDDKN